MARQDERTEEVKWKWSGSVSGAVSAVAGDKDPDVTAGVLVNAILDRAQHRSEYARGLASEWSPDLDRSTALRQTAEKWIKEVETLFDPTRAAEEDAESNNAQQSSIASSSKDERNPWLHGRLAIYGLALLDTGLRRRLEEDDILAALESEITPPVGVFLTDDGRRMRDFGDQISPLSDDPLRSSERDRLDRAAFASYLAERISYLRIFSERAISIRLFGPWGSGKSTLFNFIEEDLSARPSLDLSPSVATVKDQYERREGVSAAQLANDVIDEQYRETTVEKRSEDSVPTVSDPNQAMVDRRSVESWLEEIRTLFDPDAAPTLDSGLVLVGLGMLDTDVKEHLTAGRVLTKVVEEMDRPIDELLTDRGHLRRIEIDEPDDDVESTDDSESLNLLSEEEMLEFEAMSERPLEAADPDPESTDETNDPDDDSEEQPAWTVVRFNAWQHQHIEPPWWALMDRVFHEVEPKLDRGDKYREYWWRLSSRRLLLLVGTTVAVWLVAIFVLPAILDLVPGSFLGGLSGFAENLGTIIALLTTIWAGMEFVSRPLFLDSAQAARSYVEYSGEPMKTIKERFETLINRTPGRVLVFVDDLDRCKSEYAVTLLEGIQTLFGDAAIVFVVAADRRWLDACFEEVYRDQSGVVRYPGKSLGALFSEKAFQLSAPVPGVPDTVHGTYWNHLIQVTEGKSDESGMDNETTEQGGSTATASPLRTAQGPPDKDQITRWALPEVRDRTEHMLQKFAPLLDKNPRSMKQLVNAYSLNRALTDLTQVDVNREPLALWTILTLRWPELSKYLETHPSVIREFSTENNDDRLATIDADLRPLFVDPEVRAVLNWPQDTADTTLDTEVIRHCAQLHS